MKKGFLNKRLSILIGGAALGLVLIVLLINYIILINSTDYKLEKIGYSKETIVLINEKLESRDIDHLLTKDFNQDLGLILQEKYFIYDNLYTYLDFSENYEEVKSKHSDIRNSSDEEKYKNIVAMVNVGSNNNWYTDIKAADISKGDLILTNKFNQLLEGYAPEDLEPVRNWYSYGSQQISAHVFDAFLSMYTDAEKEGLKLIINSSYRSYDQQANVYGAQKRSVGEAKADELVARPGHSEHQTGLAIDLTGPSSTLDDFEDSDEFVWLQENAHKYGFILRYPKEKTYLTGYDYESWHYRFIGVDAATKIYNSDITFDEYYAFYLR